ncbi:MAG: ORF6C domain-containing protein, partial [Candidatus Promineifilaceae bacterium]
YGGVYGELYRKFGITSYKQLPVAKFDEAMAWLNEWRESIEGEVPF